MLVLALGLLAAAVLVGASQGKPQLPRVVTQPATTGALAAARGRAESDPERAAAWLSAAYLAGDDSTATRYLLARAHERLDGLRPTITWRACDNTFHVASSSAGVLVTGTMRACSLDGAVNLFRTSKEPLVAAFVPTPDGTRSALLRWDESLEILRADGSFERVLRRPGRGAQHGGHAAFSPDGSLLAVSGMAAELWSVEGDRMAVIDEKAFTGQPAFSPDGGTLAIPNHHGFVGLYDLMGKRKRALYGFGGAVYTAAFSPDGKRLVAAGIDRTARVFDPASGIPLARLDGHGDAVYAARFSADGSLLVTASYAGDVHVWDANSFEHLQRVDLDARISSMALAADGNLWLGTQRPHLELLRIGLEQRSRVQVATWAAGLRWRAVGGELRRNAPPTRGIAAARGMSAARRP